MNRTVKILNVTSSLRSFRGSLVRFNHLSNRERFKHFLDGSFLGVMIGDLDEDLH